MAKGKFHVRFNLLIGALLVGFLLLHGSGYAIAVAFVSGVLLATFIFSPDIDLAPGNKGLVLRFVLYPYAILFKHRGISHSLLFGTITRIVYSIALFFLLVFIFSKMGYIRPMTESYFLSIWKFITGYSYQIFVYKVLTWFYLGMFLSDVCHIVVDKTSSFFKRLI